MVTTSRKFARIIRSRAATSPFLIFPASSISCSEVKRGSRPISFRYLSSPLSRSFMIRTYSTERMRCHCASVGFCGATYELVAATSLEIASTLLNCALLPALCQSPRRRRLTHAHGENDAEAHFAAVHLFVGFGHAAERIFLDHRVHASQRTEFQCVLR